MNQHSDAKELSALYISSGVPIYPRSLGHSYHTMVWRMGIEAQEMQSRITRETTSSEEAAAGDTSENEVPVSEPVDRFFSERYETRAREGLNYSISYLEEKSLFRLNAERHSKGTNNFSGSLRRQLSMASRRLNAQPGQSNQNHLGHGQLHEPHELPSVHGRARGLSRSNSFSDTSSQGPKVLVKVHRHLLDQHLLGRPCVDDKDGTMLTAPINFAADFFHPVFKLQSKWKPGFDQGDPFSSHEGLFAGKLFDAPRSHVNGVHALGTGAGNVGDMRGQPRSSAVGSSLFDRTDSDSESGNTPPHLVARVAEAIFEPPNGAADTVVVAARQARNQDPSPSSHTGSLVRDEHATVVHPGILANVDLDVYSAVIANKKSEFDVSDEREIRNILRSRFAVYQRRLEGMLAKQDHYGCDECILDFWDEFLPETASIHYYDRKTAVPRISCLHKFLTTPCPKAIGVVQCEIERIKVGPKKKGAVNMKGRFFPTYEYRLFIRHRIPDTMDGSEPLRRDTVLMTAKNKSRKLLDAAASSNATNKKGSNSYYLETPDNEDIEHHLKFVNGSEANLKDIPNGADNHFMRRNQASPMGRLQSNFIGTEFQIFSPQQIKKPKLDFPNKRSSTTLPSDLNSPSGSEDEIGYDSSGFASDNGNLSRRRGRFSRLSLRRNVVDNPTIDEEDVAPIRRSRSSGDVNEGSRRTRPSRRAIANNSDEVLLQRVAPAPLEVEDGAITYTANLLGSRPRIMDVCIPKVSYEGVAGAEWKKYLEKCIPDSDVAASNRMLNHLKQMQQRMENDDRTFPRPNATNVPGTSAVDDYSPPDDFGLLALQNRPPWWNIELGSFVLNFGGRVSVASVKNFQLCDRNDQDYIMLQFGRIQGRHSFTMDFRHPLTAVQAFAIAISSLQSKLSLG